MVNVCLACVFLFIGLLVAVYITHNDSIVNPEPDKEKFEILTKSEDLSIVEGMKLVSLGNLVKYNNNLYIAGIKQDSLDIYCCRYADDNNFTLLETAYVGNCYVYDSDHTRPEVFIDNEKIHIVTCYRSSVQYFSSQQVVNMSFSGGKIPFIDSWTFSYPHMFTDKQDKLHMVVRAQIYIQVPGSITYKKGVMIISETDSGWTLNHKTSIFEGFEYFDAVFDKDNELLYVSCVGNRTIPSEVRSGCYFAYSRDFGETWFSANDTLITFPEIIYNGNTSRCDVEFDNKLNPIVAISYCYYGVERDTIIMTWSNGWKTVHINPEKGYTKVLEPQSYYYSGKCYVFLWIAEKLEFSYQEPYNITIFSSAYPPETFKMENFAIPNSTCSKYTFDKQYIYVNTSITYNGTYNVWKVIINEN